MYSKIKILRIRGSRRSDAAIAADPGVVGNLIACRVAGVHEMDLVDPASGSALTRMVATLREPQIVAMQAERMLLLGWERIGEGRGADEHRQEWSVEVMMPEPK